MQSIKFIRTARDPIWMYCGVDTNSGHWQYTGGNLSTTSTLIPFAAQGGGIYKATVNLAQYLCIPEGTMVYGIDLLFGDQYWSGGDDNNKTINLYINIGDANLAINPPTGCTS